MTTDAAAATTLDTPSLDPKALRRSGDRNRILIYLEAR